MNVIVLAGGKGTRLASRVPHLPKALAPIDETPFLDLVLKQLQIPLITKIILATGYQAPLITSFISRYSSSVPILLSEEPFPLGTGGALLNALSYVDSSSLLVMNGDTFCSLSIESFYAFHKEKQGDLTIACRYEKDCSRYGSITLNDEDQILHMKEKNASLSPGLMSCGMYWMETALLQPYPIKPCSLEKDLFPLWIEKKAFGYATDATFIDIGTESSYDEAQTLLQPWI